MNQRKETTMLTVIIGAAVALGAINMGFEQGQANPDAKSFFQSDSHIVHQDGSKID